MPALILLAPLSTRVFSSTPDSPEDLDLPHLLPHLRSLLAEVPAAGRDPVEAVEEVLADFEGRKPTAEEVDELAIALDILRVWLYGYEAAKKEFEVRPL
jgi:hypothetical protein